MRIVLLLEPEHLENTSRFGKGTPLPKREETTDLSVLPSIFSSDCREGSLMKRLQGVAAVLMLVLLMMLGSISALAQDIPAAPRDGYVLDTLDWFTPEEETKLNTVLQQLEADTTVEIAVVTLNDCGEDPQDFRNRLFREWGIGQAETNTGLLILMCYYDGAQGRRTLEQEVGYGMEGVVPDLQTARFADAFFVPKAQAGDPGQGMIDMVDAYNTFLRGQELEWPQAVAQKEATLSNFQLFCIIMVLLFLLIFLILLVANSGSSGGYGGSSSTWSSTGDSNTTWTSSSSDSSSDSSFGSFGGGSSGGGGSSTSW